MCRWVAHAGPEIYLEDLIFHQEHSIVRQSLAATQSAWATNGDGFGVAWYNQRTVPGLFKDVLPAWNDANLRSIAAHTKTKLFFAHVHYPHREGTTDSEALFLVARSKGLIQDPIAVIQATLRDVTTIMDKYKADEPMRISCALTNGQDMWAFRYSSDDQSPSMYYGAPHTRASENGLHPITTIASEPLDSDAAHWFKVEERNGLHWTASGLEHFKITV
jgi:predicted glutamine amidotransferase